MQKEMIKLHLSAEALLDDIGAYTFKDEVASNIVLAHALDLSKSHQDTAAEEMASQTEALCDERNGLKQTTAHWLTLWDADGADKTEAELRLMLVVSCLDWCVGSYPLFIWSPLTKDETLTFSRRLAESLPQLCDSLLNAVGRQRVFAMFGRTDLVRALSEAWSQRAKATITPEPFYVGYLSWCSENTLKTSSKTIQEDHCIRLASQNDRDGIAILCMGFAQESVQYKLTTQEAEEEAKSLLSRKRVWLYETAGQIVSICAAARQSRNVATITKVYTAPSHRQNGYAELLVREAVKTLLSTKSHVALYVGADNQARSVYDRVGFIGLSENDTGAGLEDALELGFEGMTLGKW